MPETAVSRSIYPSPCVSFSTAMDQQFEVLVAMNCLSQVNTDDSGARKGRGTYDSSAFGNLDTDCMN